MAYNLNAAIEGGNIALTTAGLTGLSGGASTYSTGATALSFMVDGKFLTKTQVSGGTTPTTDGITSKAFLPQAANTVCTYVWSINAAGTIHVSQGPIVAWTDTTANSTPAPFPPGGCPALDAPFAYVTLENGSTGSAFTLGTSLWNQTGVVTPVVIALCSIPAAVPLSA